MVLIPINYYPEREKPPTYSNLYIAQIALVPGKNHVDSEAWDMVKDRQMIKERLDQHIIEPMGGIIQPSSKEIDEVAKTVVPEPPKETTPPPPVPDKSDKSATTARTTSSKKEKEDDKSGATTSTTKS